MRWIEGVLIWQASFLLYKQTSFGAVYWIPLTHYFFHNKNKKPKDLNFIQMVVGAMDKSGTRIEIAGSQRSQRCPRISRVTPVRLDSLRSNVFAQNRFFEPLIWTENLPFLCDFPIKRCRISRRIIWYQNEARSVKQLQPTLLNNLHC